MAKVFIYLLILLTFQSCHKQPEVSRVDWMDANEKLEKMKIDPNDDQKLLQAIEAENETLIDLFVDSVPPLVVLQTRDTDPLIEASSLGKTKLVKHLVNDKKMNINTKDESGRTPLTSAILAQRFDVVDFLLDKGADVNLAGQSLNPPLLLAAGYGNLNLVKKLIDKKADLHHRNINSNTALTMAVKRGNKDIADYLLEKGSDPNVVSSDGNSLVHLAVLSRSPGIIQSLAGKVPVNIVNKNGQTPLSIAVYDLLIPETEILLDQGADPNFRNTNGTPILSLMIIGAVERIEEAFKESDPQKRHEIYKSAVWNSKLLAAKLVNKLADPTLADKGGVTPMMYGASLPFVMEVLLEGNTIMKGKDDINAQDGQGVSALHYAALDNSNHCIEQLLKAGANPNLKTKSGKTALQLAISAGNKDAINALQSANSPSKQAQEAQSP